MYIWCVLCKNFWFLLSTAQSSTSSTKSNSKCHYHGYIQNSSATHTIFHMVLFHLFVFMWKKKKKSICTGGIFLRTIVPVGMVYFHSILDGVIRNLEYRYNVNKFKNNDNSLVTKKQKQKHFRGIGTTELTS